MGYVMVVIFWFFGIMCLWGSKWLSGYIINDPDRSFMAMNVPMCLASAGVIMITVGCIGLSIEMGR